MSDKPDPDPDPEIGPACYSTAHTAELTSAVLNCCWEEHCQPHVFIGELTLKAISLSLELEPGRIC